jgi:hypothetical protein
MIAEDTKHNKPSTQRKGDLQAHGTDAGTPGIVHQLEDMCIVSDSGDMKTDENLPILHITVWKGHKRTCVIARSVTKVESRECWWAAERAASQYDAAGDKQTGKHNVFGP